MARESASALVIRRGPSRHTAVVGWDRSTDRFTLGQWLCGRIYERRCDIAPDGRHWIYFAMNGRWHSESKGSWTAVARTPWLKAVSYFPKGDGWHGGGLFRSSVEFWLNGAREHEVRFEGRGLKRTSKFPWHESYGGECPGVYYVRLQRDGWKLADPRINGPDGEQMLFEKRANDAWVLRKYTHATQVHPVGRGCYYDTHGLFHTKTGVSEMKPEWEWADLDGDRLVWAADGCLFAGRIGSEGLESEKLLQDFRPMQFERITAPY
jgi:hypothetical protein